MRMVVAAPLLVLAASWLAPAQNMEDYQADRSRILALENAWNQAEEQKDTKALDSLLAHTLVYIDYDGSLMNKEQFLASIKEPTLHPEQIVNESMNAYVFGDSAIVTGVYRETGTLRGKRYLRRGRFTDAWVKQKGTWQCVASQSTLISK